MALEPGQIIVDASTHAFEERLAFRPQSADVLVAAFGGQAAQLVEMGIFKEQLGDGHGVVQRLCRFDIDTDALGSQRDRKKGSAVADVEIAVGARHPRPTTIAPSQGYGFGRAAQSIRQYLPRQGEGEALPHPILREVEGAHLLLFLARKAHAQAVLKKMPVGEGEQEDGYRLRRRPTSASRLHRPWQVRFPARDCN